MIKHKSTKSKDNFLPDRTSDIKELSGPRHDLMQLGIELDDELIQRLQKNLGIEKIFAVAQRSANLIKSKPHVPVGSIPEMAYRNVANSGGNGIHSASRPFENNILHKDNKMSTSILHELSNSESRIEGRHRPQLEKMIESYRLQYIRSPERFVCALLGRKPKPTDPRDGDNMSRLVLRHRYVSEEDFLVMVRRVDRNAEDALVRSLFRLLAVDKSFGSSSSGMQSRNRSMIDLWEFLTLLKTACDESRRSFDCRTSHLATDVEFWRRSNFNLALNSETSGGGGGGGGSSKASGGGELTSKGCGGCDGDTADTNERFQKERQRKLDAMAANTQRCLGRFTASKSGGGGHLLTVAQLLGSSNGTDNTESKKGATVSGTATTVTRPRNGSKGTLLQERTNTCDVPAAMNSPTVRNAPPSPRKHFTLVARRAELLPAAGGDRGSHIMFGGSQVGEMLRSGEAAKDTSRNDFRFYGGARQSCDDIGLSYAQQQPPPSSSSSGAGESSAVAPEPQQAAERVRSQSACPVRRPSAPGLTVRTDTAFLAPRSASTLSKEQVNKTSVAFALGSARDSNDVGGGSSGIQASATQPGRIDRSFTRSFSQSEGSFGRTRQGNRGETLRPSGASDTVSSALNSALVDSASPRKKGTCYNPAAGGIVTRGADNQAHLGTDHTPAPRATGRYASSPTKPINHFNGYYGGGYDGHSRSTKLW